eukprot:10714214-Ditylum_brightwellii.AAC.1
MEAKFPNRTKIDQLDGLVTIRWEPKMANKKEQVYIVFHHYSFPNKEVHAVEWWVKVLEEGTAEHFFGGEGGGATQEQGEERGEQGIPSQALVLLKKVWIFASALIKKRRCCWLSAPPICPTKQY